MDSRHVSLACSGGRGWTRPASSHLQLDPETHWKCDAVQNQIARRASPEKPVRRPDSGLLGGRDDRGPHRTSLQHPRSPRDFPHVDDDLQRYKALFARDRQKRDALALESDVAESIARKVEVTVTGEEHARLTAARSVSPEVYESYLKGRFALGKGNSRTDIDESIADFEDAIKQDPTFAPAYVGLANAHSALASVFIGAPPELERAKVVSAARKALELDPELAEAHTMLAVMQQEQWHWTEAETEFKRTLELNPSNATAHNGLARWLVCHGRIEEALQWVRRGRELDPVAVSGTEVAWILFQSRRYDEAMQELRSVLAVRPDDSAALWFLGFVLIANNQPNEAIPVLEKTFSVSGHSSAVI